ncbi:MAG: FAD-dependent monooxygenase [Candidatus Accumulibacter sp.]|jgi:2-octaprenyl-6-methoxyphenol hydroxylase|uniref:FAD-dependent monooxygenase n=1 Tax=Candidatus Accumulibacter affinis TaxID=2954384 RepID=A0A935T895_9PROT|nr:FAD-dependent monooxygenase [Candidatus Accumulibacter affinis]MBP9803853.1 FAD-dependent monooxygenase [Accumulibacter sp.]
MAEDLDTMDIVIVGAGPVGMTLALALAESRYRIVLVDSRPRGAWAGDPRALALSYGTRQLLESLGAWNGTAATPIETIHVSQRGGFGRTLIDAADYGIPALGYVMRYRDLAATLDARIAAVQRLDNSTISEVKAGSAAVEVLLDCDGEMRRIAARLIVHAEGTPGQDADVRVYEYRQHAVVAEVRPFPEHGRRAWERFTPDGPLALLPLGQDYSVVFTVPPVKAGDLLNLDDDGFLAALRAQFGERIDFITSGPRASFPLALRVRQKLAAARQVWIGNAAQSLHPVSGQGFNLGLRDSWELAAALRAHAGSDAGAALALASYARGRRIDRSGSMAFTDGLVRTFSNDLAPLRIARGLSLLTLDLLPPLRHFVARRMIWGARAWP